MTTDSLDLRRDDDVRRLATFLAEVCGQIGIECSGPTIEAGASFWRFVWTERRLLRRGASSVFIEVEVTCRASVVGRMSFRLEHVVSRHPTLPFVANSEVAGIPWGSSVLEVRRLLDEATLRLLDRRRASDPKLPPAPPADGGVTPGSLGGGP